jgi:SAM-dependent methyltransferase
MTVIHQKSFIAGCALGALLMKLITAAIFGRTMSGLVLSSWLKTLDEGTLDTRNGSKQNTIGYIKAETATASESNVEFPRYNASEINNGTKISVLESRNQLSHATAMDRYPEEYAFAKQLYEGVRDKKTNHVKILSFGCSTGEEAITLAQRYFTKFAMGNSTRISIYGVDIDDKTLAQARQLVAASGTKTASGIDFLFFNGLKTPIDAYGPYDVVFANSVLCVHPIANRDANCFVYAGRSETKMECSFQSLDTIYPYQLFQDTVERLDAVLSLGGILAINNAMYEFAETKLASKRYKTTHSCPKQFVPQFQFNQSAFSAITERPCIYQKINSDS